MQQKIVGKMNSETLDDKKIIEHTTTDYYKLGLEGLVAVLKSLSTVSVHDKKHRKLT